MKEFEMRFAFIFAVLVLICGCEPTTLGGPSAIMDKSGKGVPIPDEVKDRGFMGIDFQKDLPKSVVIKSVTSGSPADKSGILPGDVVKLIDSNAIESVDHFFEFAKRWKPREAVALTLKRNDETLTVKVELLSAFDFMVLSDQNRRKGIQDKTKLIK